MQLTEVDMKHTCLFPDAGAAAAAEILDKLKFLVWAMDLATWNIAD